jgi:hypothetical protein
MLKKIALLMAGLTLPAIYLLAQNSTFTGMPPNASSNTNTTQSTDFSTDPRWIANQQAITQAQQNLQMNTLAIQQHIQQIGQNLQASANNTLNTTTPNNIGLPNLLPTTQPTTNTSITTPTAPTTVAQPAQSTPTANPPAVTPSAPPAPLPTGLPPANNNGSNSNTSNWNYGF